MAYQDPQFRVQRQVNVVGNSPAVGVSLGTSTANSTNTFTGVAGSQVNGTLQFPIFKNPIKVVAIRVYGKTGPTAGNTGGSIFFMNGTSTMGTAALPATGTYADATITALTTDSHGVETGAAYFTSTSANEILVITTVTSTASAIALGSYSVDLTFRDLFTV